MAKAGDTTYSLGTIMIDADGRVRVRLDAQLIGRGNTQHQVRGGAVVVPIDESLAAQIASLRATVEAAVKSALPENLKGATEVPATSARAARRAAFQAREAAQTEERRAAREAARARPGREQ